MNISTKRPGLFAGPIFIAAAITMAGAGAARAACADVIAAFNNAIAARQMDAAISGLDEISDNPSKECLGRLADHRAKLVDFLLDHAAAPDLDPAVRARALDKAEKIVEVSGHWQGKEKIADYYFAQKTPESRVKAHTWYMAAVTALATPGAGAPATDQQKTELMTRLAAAQSLANDDKGGRAKVAFRGSRELDGRLGGIYSPALRVVGVNALPAPINFVYDKATFTENGEKAMQELIEAAKDVKVMTLVGHADPRGSEPHNVDLSRDRAYAVASRLVQAGIPQANITVRWKGSSEPFDIKVLADPGSLDQEAVYQLDRRVEFRMERK